MTVLKLFSVQGVCLAVVVLGLLFLLALWLYRRGSGVAGRSAPPLGHRWQDQVDDLDGGILGRPVLEDGVLVVEASDIGFADQPDPELSKVDQLGLVSDVQKEIVSVCEFLEKNDGNKDDFFSMMAMVMEKYPRIAGHSSTAELSRFIRDRVPFHLSAEELENLWG